MTPAQHLRAAVAVLRDRGATVAEVCAGLGVRRRALERYLAQARLDSGESPRVYRDPPPSVVRLACILAEHPEIPLVASTV